MLCPKVFTYREGKTQSYGDEARSHRGNLALILVSSFLSWPLLHLILCLFAQANFLPFLNIPSSLASAQPPMAPWL